MLYRLICRVISPLKIINISDTDSRPIKITHGWNS